MEEEIVREIMKECRLSKEKVIFIKLLMKICLDNEVINIKEKIIEFLV